MKNHLNTSLHKSLRKDIKPRYQKPEAVKLLEKVAFEQKKRLHPDFPYLPKTKYRDDNTNALTKCVLDWVTSNGGQAERITSTGMYTTIKGQQRWIKGSGTNGTADISATIKGISVKIEVKCKATGDHYQSQAQKDYQKQIEHAGGVYVIARDFTQFYQWYKGFTDG